MTDYLGQKTCYSMLNNEDTIYIEFYRTHDESCNNLYFCIENQTYLVVDSLTHRLRLYLSNENIYEFAPTYNNTDYRLSRIFNNLNETINFIWTRTGSTYLLTRISNSSEDVVNLSYSSLQLDSISYSQGNESVSLTYTSSGVTIKKYSGSTLTYRYILSFNSSNLLTSVDYRRPDESNGTIRRISYTYDGDNRVINTSLHNYCNNLLDSKNISYSDYQTKITSFDGHFITYSFDDLGRIVNISNDQKIYQTTNYNEISSFNGSLITNQTTVIIPSKNYLRNGGFEDDLSSWTINTPSYISIVDNPFDLIRTRAQCTEDKNKTLVENARNYITVRIDGDGELVGLDNGDSTDYDEYFTDNKKLHSRKLFQNRLIAIIRGKTKESAFTVSAASKGLPVSSIKYDGSGWSENSEEVMLTPEKDFVPVRKIEIICNGTTALTKENKEISVTAKVLPENASIKTIQWNPVLKECVSSDYIEVCNLQGIGSGVENAVIKAVCDGECILRLGAKNGQQHDEILSDLNFTVNGVGNPKLNPYKLIEACRLSSWDPSKEKPVVSLESGVSNRGFGPTWISFDKVDFGTEGADTIHLPIFSFDTELPVEVWDGIPESSENGNNENAGKCLLKATYKHSSIYNTFSENVFTLSRRLFGVHTISIAFKTELVFHGFYFDQTAKALSKLSALDADDIVGDSFTKTEDAVTGIGNNVNLDFANMDFGNKGAVKLTICGKSNTENNTINLKLFGENGSVKTHVIEFTHTDDYEEKTFELTEITGLQKVSFVFLPGCNFDFRWFKFSC